MWPPFCLTTSCKRTLAFVTTFRHKSSENARHNFTMWALSCATFSGLFWPPKEGFNPLPQTHLGRPLNHDTFPTGTAPDTIPVLKSSALDQFKNIQNYSLRNTEKNWVDIHACNRKKTLLVWVLFYLLLKTKRTSAGIIVPKYARGIHSRHYCSGKRIIFF